MATQEQVDAFGQQTSWNTPLPKGRTAAPSTTNVGSGAGGAVAAAATSGGGKMPGFGDQSNPADDKLRQWFGNLFSPNTSTPGTDPAAQEAGDSEDDTITKQAWAILLGYITPEDIPSMPPAALERAQQLNSFLKGLNKATGTDTSAADIIKQMLGSVVGGGGGGASAVPKADPLPTTPEEQDAYVREHYGFMAGYLADAELGPIIRQAAVEGWTSTRLQGALMNTNYWKSSSDAMRTWDATANIDPASTWQKVLQKTQELKARAQSLGLNISGTVDLGQYGGVQDRLSIFAARVLREGWSEQMITEGLFNEAGYDPTKQQSGQIAATTDAIKKAAGSYMTAVSDTTANQWAQDVLTGKQTMDGITSLFKQQAKGRFGTLSAQIDQGFTPEQIFDSYKQDIAKEMELDPEMVNLMDPKWRPVIDYSPDGSSPSRPMTLAETQKYVRQQPEWVNTQGAKQLAAQTSELIGQTFGKVG